MELLEWDDDVTAPDDEEDDPSSCFSSESCIEELIREAPGNCLFCLLGELGEEDE